MPLTIEVKSYDNAVKAKREAAAKRVMYEFSRLPNLKILAFFDDEDWQFLRDEIGESNRGLFTSVKAGKVQWESCPDYLKDCIFVDNPSSLLRRRAFDYVIYHHGSTCVDEVGLTMTFSHELQHFIQHGFNRKLWAENYLLPRLPKHVIDITGLNWPDIPAEREARIVAKRTGVKLCGPQAVEQYISRGIAESTSQKDADDWRFSQHVNTSLPYDLASETKRIFQRLKPHRQHLEDFLDQMRGDADFRNLNLAHFSGYLLNNMGWREPTAWQRRRPLSGFSPDGTGAVRFRGGQ